MNVILLYDFLSYGSLPVSHQKEKSNDKILRIATKPYKTRRLLKLQYTCILVIIREQIALIVISKFLKINRKEQYTFLAFGTASDKAMELKCITFALLVLVLANIKTSYAGIESEYFMAIYLLQYFYCRLFITIFLSPYFYHYILMQFFISPYFLIKINSSMTFTLLSARLPFLLVTQRGKNWKKLVSV